MHKLSRTKRSSQSVGALGYLYKPALSTLGLVVGGKQTGGRRAEGLRARRWARARKDRAWALPPACHVNKEGRKHLLWLSMQGGTFTHIILLFHTTSVIYTPSSQSFPYLGIA